jgi:HSP20 family protein
MFFNNETKNTDTRTVRTVKPSVDIQELPASYIVRLDMPGADKRGIKVQVNDRVLSVSGSVPAPFNQEAVMLFADSVPTEFQREFTLADNVDLQNIDAVFELGVLTVTLKKKEQYLPKEIAVQ